MSYTICGLGFTNNAGQFYGKSIRRAVQPSRPVASRNRRLTVKSLAQAEDATLSASTSGRGAHSECSPHDPFIAASIRLQNLLAGVGNGEDEFLDTLVAEESPEMKIQTQIPLGAIVTVAAVAIASLCGKDPWGGASLSLHSLGAAAVGLLASVPMVAARMWSWTPAAAKAIPALDDMHIAQINVVSPWFSRMNVGHLAIMMVLEVLPMTMLLLPAAQSGITASFGMYMQLMHHGMATVADGTDGAAVCLGALLFTSAVGGLGKVLELGVSEEEHDMVTTAVDNADRYYRLMAMDMNTRVHDAQRASLAFKSVAQAWLDTRNDASLVGGAICMADILFLGGTWYASGDLTAPAVAALAINWVDYHHLHSRVLKQGTNINGKGNTGI